MPILEIVSIPVNEELRRLKIYRNGNYLGEYERSSASDIGEKSREIVSVAGLLTDIYEHMGEFVVRWDPVASRKSIRVDGTEVASIPKACWQKPWRS